VTFRKLQIAVMAFMIFVTIILWKDKILETYSAITVDILLLNALLFFAVYYSSNFISKLHRMANWRLTISFFDNEGVKVPYFGVFYVLLMISALPVFAYIEEVIFRNGTNSWMEGIVRSIIFAALHILSGMKLASFPLFILMGMWFTYQYFLGGVELSTVHHTCYNLVIFSLVFIQVLQRDAVAGVARLRGA